MSHTAIIHNKALENGITPADWPVTKLRPLLKRPPRYGINAAAVPEQSRLPAYIRITDISVDGRFDPTPKVSVDHPASVDYFLDPGDIVVARTGASVGKSYLYNSADGRLVYAGFLICLSADERKLDPRYLAYCLQTKDYWDWVSRTSVRSGQPGINSVELASFTISVPNLAEQKLIAAALADVDSLITSLDRLVAKKQAVKQGLMQQLLTGRTRLSGFTDAWKHVKLGEVASMGSGGTPSSGVARFYGGNIPWVSISDMTAAGKYIQATEKSLTQDGITSSAAKLYEPNVVLFAMYASLGECSLAIGRVSSSQAILGISVGRSLDREFLYYYLTSIKSQVRDMGQQGTQSNLNAGMVRNFDILLPHITEQRAIAKTLFDADSEIDLIRRRRDKARSLKQGLMQELLSGRTRLTPEGSAR